jgi:hypothetical protein
MPPRPLSPSRQTAPPLVLAGAPAYNKTYFCDGSATLCYTHVAAAANFDQQRATCEAMGGELVRYNSR